MAASGCGYGAVALMSRQICDIVGVLDQGDRKLAFWR